MTSLVLTAMMMVMLNGWLDVMMHKRCHGTRCSLTCLSCKQKRHEAHQQQQQIVTVSHWPGWQTWGVSASVGGVWDHWRRPLFCKLALKVLQVSCGKCFDTEDLLRRILRCCKSFVQDKQQSKKNRLQHVVLRCPGKGGIKSGGKKVKKSSYRVVKAGTCGSQQMRNHPFEVVAVHLSDFLHISLF